MSLINFSNKFIYVHIPKTGGSSVTRMLSSYTQVGDLEIGGTPFGEGIAPFYEKRFQLKKHSTAQEIQGLLGMEKYQSMWSFATVRNPYFRALSLFRFLKQWGGGPNQKKIATIKTFGAFIHSPILPKLYLAQPQSHWIFNSANELQVNQWIQLEALETEMTALREKLGIPVTETKLVQVNTSTKANRDIRELSDSGIQERIYEIYKIDFLNFGYSKELSLEKVHAVLMKQTHLMFRIKHLINKPKEWL